VWDLTKKCSRKGFEIKKILLFHPREGPAGQAQILSLGTNAKNPKRRSLVVYCIITGKAKRDSGLLVGW
jgi:hypothetical protein